MSPDPRLRKLLRVSTDLSNGNDISSNKIFLENSKLYLTLLGILAALPALSIDISAPTLILLPVELGMSIFSASLTISLFMVGFAMGQFAGGHISDHVGRRPVLLSGLACFALAGTGCALSTSALAITAFRLTQGAGAGMCSVLSFAMIQDLYKGDIARSKRSHIIVIVGLVPLLAPALGSVLISIAGWRSVHSILAIVGSILLILCWLLIDETKPTKPQNHANEAELVDSKSWLERSFVGNGIANALSYGCIFAYIAGSPVVIMDQMGLSSPVYAAVFASTAAALSVGAWTSGKLSRRGFGVRVLLGPSLALGAVGSIGLAALLATRMYHPIALLPVMMSILFARGIIAPNLQHRAIESRKDRAGTASAIIGLMQLLTGALASALVGVLLPRFGSLGAAVPMATFAVSAFLVWWWTETAKSTNPQTI